MVRFDCIFRYTYNPSGIKIAKFIPPDVFFAKLPQNFAEE